jgi:hypothetical protein
MERNNFLAVVIVILSFTGCNNFQQIGFLPVEKEIKLQKKSFGKRYKLPDLLHHFPNIVNDSNVLRLRVSPPTSPPEYDCLAQFGEIYLFAKLNKFDVSMTLDTLNSILYSSNRLFLINQLDFKNNKFAEEKFNNAYKNKMPIPYFNRFDFNLGFIDESIFVDGDTLFLRTYSTPSDLKVFVIDAKPGNFWKFDCKEPRPKSLKDWQNGYSRGIATSEKENIIIYWAMIW